MTDREFQEFVVSRLVLLTEGQEKLSKDIARIEYEHREKLAALFDGYQSIKETLDDHTDRLQRIEDKLETHEIQINVLDSTKANKRKVK
jgi:uncharacterized protein involved in exopolysaccharide biosynthesis